MHLAQLPILAQLLEVDSESQFRTTAGKCSNELLLKGNQRARRLLFQIVAARAPETAGEHPAPDIRASTLSVTTEADVDQGEVVRVPVERRETAHYFSVQAPAGDLGLLFEENQVRTPTNMARISSDRCISLNLQACSELTAIEADDMRCARLLQGVASELPRCIVSVGPFGCHVWGELSVNTVRCCAHRS